VYIQTMHRPTQTQEQYWSGRSVYQNQQELSYRKQIARKLRTQFVEGISVTLKSTLRSLKINGNGTIGQIIHDLL